MVPYTAAHLLEAAGPLVADTTGKDKPVPMQQRVSTVAIRVTIDCPPMLLRRNPASKGEQIEGGDAAIGKAENIGTSSTDEAVADRGTSGPVEMVSYPQSWDVGD